MRSISTLLAFIYVAGASESARDIRPLGSRSVEGINEVKEEILSSLNAVNLEGILSEAVFPRKVEIARTIQSGFVKIASFVEDAKSDASALDAMETVQEKMDEKFIEMDKLLPAGTDARILAKEFLNRVVTAGKAKLDDLIMEKKTARQSDAEKIDVQMMTVAEEVLLAPTIAGYLKAGYIFGLPGEIMEVWDFFNKFIAANFQQVREIESILSRFKIVADFVNESGRFSPASLYKKSLLISCAAAVKRNLVVIANFDSVGQIAVRYFALNFVDLFSDSLAELDEDETHVDGADEIRGQYEGKWFSAVLQKFIDSYADGYVDTFLKLSEVIKVARNELSGSLEDGKKHGERLRGLIPQIGKLLSKFDEIEKESNNKDEEEDDDVDED